MKLKILITGSAPHFAACVVQSIQGSDLLKGLKCPSVERAQTEVERKLHSAYKNIPLELEWEIQ